MKGPESRWEGGQGSWSSVCCRRWWGEPRSPDSTSNSEPAPPGTARGRDGGEEGVPVPPQLWEVGWGGCGAGPGLFSRQGGVVWSCGEVTAEGTQWSLVGLSSRISSGQR